MHKAAAAGCKYYLKLIKDFDSYNELKLNKEFLLDIGLSEKEINDLLNFN
jgi:hypothetical protein